MVKEIKLSSTCINYRKISKISPVAYIFQRPFLRGLFLEGLIFEGAYVRREICVSKSIKLACSGMEIFALFCFVFEVKFQVQAPREDYIRRSDLTEGFLCYDFGGLIFGGAYTWRGLFSEFYGIFPRPVWGYKAVSYLSHDFFLIFSSLFII